jgi:hypothetical protein
MAGWADEITETVELGDERLHQRLVALLEAFAEKPGMSIPEACGDWAATHAAYLFFDNDAVEPEAITVGAAQATLSRCRGQELVLAVQDTTSLDYTEHGKTADLGPMEDPDHRGLFVHSTLAVSVAGVPLGLIAQDVWARDAEDIGKRERRKQLPVEAKESAKWLRALKETERLLNSAGVAVLSIADREADVYELFALAAELKGQWLIRARHDRSLKGETGLLLAKVESVAPCAYASVDLPRHDNQVARQAKLEIRRVAVVLAPPKRAKGAIVQWWAQHPEVERLAPEKLQPISVAVILVTEVDPPKGSQPLRWLLLTSLAADTPEQILRCVDDYRLRWLIERYHFVLKSGCQVERLQLETAERLKRVLAVYAVVAWRLLWLTYEARAHPEAPCSLVLDEDAWRILLALRSPTTALPTQPPTLQAVVRQIAMLGGFLGRKGDGAPGVKTIWRGLRRLNDLVLAFRLLKEHPDLFSPTSQATCV